MTARDEEGESGKTEVRVFEEGGLHVGLKMINAEERLLVVIGQTFSKGQADEEGPDEAWPLGHGKGIDVSGRKRGPLQTLGHDIPYGPEMLPRGQFGNDSTVGRMDLVLGENDAAQDLALGRDDSGGPLIARTPPPQYFQRR